MHTKPASDTTVPTSDETRESTPLSRRSFLSVGATLAGVSSAGALGVASAAQGVAPTATKPASSVGLANGATTSSSDRGAVVDTQYGKVRGVTRRGIHSFKGIPYGADTGGANRWMMAKPPAPWAGVKSTSC